MRIETFCDLEVAWDSCSLLGKIFFFWLIVIGWCMIFISSIWLNAVVGIGQWGGLIEIQEEDEP